MNVSLLRLIYYGSRTVFVLDVDDNVPVCFAPTTLSVRETLVYHVALLISLSESSGSLCAFFHDSFELVSSHALFFILLLFKDIKNNLAFRIHHQKKNMQTFSFNVELLDCEQVLKYLVHQLRVEIYMRETAGQLKFLKALQELEHLLSQSVIVNHLEHL